MLLRELYEAKAKHIVAVMPGGFHPFHPGHKSLYDWAVKTFGQKNVYVAATNDTAARPFPFDVKKKLASMAGVPESNFIQVKSPFNAMSYQDIVDDNTALVFVRSQKDKAEQPLPDQTKKNGEPGYLRTYTGKDLNTADEMGYMAYGPTINFDFSGMQIKSASELRAAWPEMSDEDKLKAAKLMYGNGAPVAVKLLDQALGGQQEDATPDEEDEFHKKLDKLVHKTFGHSSDEKKKKTDEAELNEVAPAVAAVIWILKWTIRYGAWPVLKWLLKKHGGKIFGGAAAAYYIDQGWDWVKNAIGEEYAQLLIDNKFEIGMAVALIVGAVVLKKYIEKQGEKLVSANESLIARS
jgi:hypothetical protein